MSTTPDSLALMWSRSTAWQENTPSKFSDLCVAGLKAVFPQDVTAIIWRSWEHTLHSHWLKYTKQNWSESFTCLKHLANYQMSRSKTHTMTGLSPDTLRLAEEVTVPAVFVATQVYTPLSSTDASWIHRDASPVSLQKWRVIGNKTIKWNWTAGCSAAAVTSYYMFYTCTSCCNVRCCSEGRCQGHAKRRLHGGDHRLYTSGQWCCRSHTLHH